MRQGKYREIAQEIFYSPSLQRTEQPKYNDEEKAYRDLLIKELMSSKEQRDRPHPEFNEMSYVEWYESNAKAAISYQKPRRAKHESPLVSGITEEKVNTMLSTLLNFNLAPNIKAYDDKENEIMQLGEAVEALVEKSRKIETVKWDVMRPLIYKELLNQGTVFVEEAWVEWEEVDKKLKKGFDWFDMTTMQKTWEEEKIKKGECRVTKIPGVNVYLGNIKEFTMQRQPYVFTREYIKLEIAEQMFGHLPRWKNVPKTIQKFAGISGEDVKFGDWTLDKLPPGMVEVIRYQNKPRNEFQIIINGVLQLPVGFPLQALSGVNDYTIKKGDLEPISSEFAYSKAIPAKTKVDQQTFDEFMRLMVQKTQKSFKPPVANNSRKKINGSIYIPGKIVDNLDADKIKPIGDVSGVSQSEFAFVQWLKGILDNKSINRVMEGQFAQKGTSATEVVEVKKQQMLRLGLAIWGVVNLETEMAWGRLHNIVNYWTEAIDTRYNKAKEGIENVYRTVSIDDTFEDGTSGERIIDFREDLPSNKQREAAERLKSRQKKKTVKIQYINPEALKNMNLSWYVEITPTEKNADVIERQELTEGITEFFKLFGPQAGNIDYFKREYVKKRGWDPDQALVEGPQVQASQQAAAQNVAGQPANGGGGPGANILAALQRNPQAGAIQNQQAQGNPTQAQVAAGQ